MKRSTAGPALALAVLVGLVGLVPAPAAADNDGVGVMVGAVMNVGTTFAATCAMTLAQPGTVAPGIGLPLGAGGTPPKAEKVFTWVYPGPTVVIPPAFVVVGQTTPAVLTAELGVCGRMTSAFNRVAILGPWCDLSKGYNGKGKIRLYDPATPTASVTWMSVRHLTWKFSAGAVLPVIGMTRKQSGTGATEATKGAAKDEWGNIFALLSRRGFPVDAPSGAGDCASIGGGTGFRVDGLIALKSAGDEVTDTQHWNAVPGFSKCHAPLACPLYEKKPDEKPKPTD